MWRIRVGTTGIGFTFLHSFLVCLLFCFLVLCMSHFHSQKSLSVVYFLTSVSQFPSTAVTNYHKLSGLNNAYLSYRLIVQEPKTGPPGLKSECQQSSVLSRGSRGESMSLPFLDSRSCLHSLACGHFVYLKASSCTPSPSHVVTLIPLWPQPSTVKDLCDSLGPPGQPGITSPTLRSADWQPEFHLWSKFSFATYVTYSQILGIRAWEPIEGIIILSTIMCVSFVGIFDVQVCISMKMNATWTDELFGCLRFCG